MAKARSKELNVPKTYRGRHPADPTGEVFGDTHWPFPNRYDFVPPIYAAFDLKTGKWFGTGEYRTLLKYAGQLSPKSPVAIGPVGELFTYRCLHDGPLKKVYEYLSGSKAGKMDRETMLAEVADLALSLKPLPTPESLLTRPELAPTERATRVTSEAPAPSTPAKETRRERTPAAPSKRPKAGTATGRVWDIADELRAKHPSEDRKTFKARVFDKGTGEGINASTVTTQYSKWWNTTQN